MKEKIIFQTLAGDETLLPVGNFESNYVTKFASEYFGQDVICKPGVLVAGTTALAWQVCEQRIPFFVVGYFIIAISEIKSDFEYGIGAFIPLSAQTSLFGVYDVNYVNGKINFKKRSVC